MAKKQNNSTHRPSLIWFVGGETGGHVMPLVAVAQELKKNTSIRIVFLGQKNSFESNAAQRIHVRFLPIPVAKFRRYFTVGSFFLNVRDVIIFGWAIIKSYGLIKRHRPRLIFSKGGPVAFPVACAAWIAGIPLVTHESDAVMGLTNRVIARFAKKALTAFPANVYPPSLARKVTHVGIPLRPEFCTKHKTASHHSLPMVLITGGSQGAVAINELVAAILPELLTIAHVMHITGERSFDRFRDLKETLPPKLRERYGVIDFTPDIASFMKESTVILSRASSAIFEIASLEKPMILIPLPSAANNHQVKNAEIFADHNAAILLIQDNLTPTLLYETIETVLTDATLRRQLREGTRNFAHCDSAKQVAEILISEIQ